MRIILVNKFLYPKGGDAISTLATGKLLSEKGHEVFFWGMKHPMNPQYTDAEYFVDNIDYEGNLSRKQKISNALKILYSFEAKKKIEKVIKRIKPDVVHLNNFAHQISPSILDILKKYGIPPIMTMRDYKIVCPSYSMLQDGKPCERCKNGKYYWCFLSKCTKNSYSKSMINVVEMYLHHRIMNIYDSIDVFISPSKFLKEKLKEMGFKHKIEYLPNFIYPEEFIPQYENKEKSICYFGRLSYEKGIATLIKAMKGLDIKLKIIGDGPLKDSLKLKVKSDGMENVNFLGYKTGDELKNAIRNSMAVVLPSECYENNPRTVLEAFALGKPVIGARIGGIPELVKDGETGYTFEAGNVEDLRSKILMLTMAPNKIVQMGKNARIFVEENFNPEKHYKELMESYSNALAKHS